MTPFNDHHLDRPLDMIIPVNISPNSAYSKLPSGLAKISHDELVLIELQGTLEVESTTEAEKDGKFVGKLKIDDNLSKPTLFIGHHLLEGKLVNLSKPLGVIHKSASGSSGRVTVSGSSEMETEASGGMDIDSQVDDGAGDKTVVWEMVAIVKKKIVFSKRPMPIVNLRS